MKTIIKLFICISLIYTPFFAFAGVAEKWEIVEKVYDSASKNVEVTARKVGATAANDPYYKARVGVSASGLGGAARTGIFGLGMYAAVTAMLAGIGWVMDEGGKVFKRETDASASNPAGEKYRWRWDYNLPEFDCYNASGCVSAGNALQEYKVKQGNTNDPIIYKECHASGTSFTCTGNYKYYGASREDTIGRFDNPQYNPGAPKEYEILSDEELGKEILGEGENTQPMPDVITDIYDPNSPIPDSAPKTKTAAALDSATPQPGTEPSGSATPNPNSDTNGDGTPDTYDPAKPDAGSKFTLPNFCTWAPAVCDFFKVQKQDNIEIKESQKTDLAQNKTFFDEVKDWFTWSKENDDLPADEKPQITEIPTPELKEDAIRWSAQCPADAQVPINMQGVSSTITFSWSPWCQLLDMIKPAIIASAYIGAAFIVLGLRT